MNSEQCDALKDEQLEEVKEPLWRELFDMEEKFKKGGENVFGEDLRRSSNLHQTAAGSAGNSQRGAETEGGADDAPAPTEQREFGDSLRRWPSSAGAC